MKTPLLILLCSSLLLCGCNKNSTASQSKDSIANTQAASETKAIDPDRQQLMDELAAYKDSPDLPPAQEKLVRAYYELLQKGSGDLDEIREFMLELQEIVQATAAEQTAPEETPSASENFEVRLSAIPLSQAESNYAFPMTVNKLEITSLNDASTSITGIKVNRGNCGVGGGEGYQNMRYGSVGHVFLRCDPKQVREVILTTANGEYTYNF